MTPINANETSYEKFEILGREALFTDLRIDRKSLPEGLYAYDLRDCDDCSGDPCEVKSFVLVNHWGTVIVKEPIEGADDGVMLDDDDYNYLGDNMTLEEFANSALTTEHSASTMEQSM
ncbi:MAG: hypothetical protein NC084_13085 [Bacteroides sp.]|nr:hypothetical protein [Eubacterium sp.]MCM1463630.1 hypothetical protein [Bacteroides sp.]